MNSISFSYQIICSTLKKAANCILQYLLSNMPNELAERTNYFCSQAGWILFLGHQKDCWCKSFMKNAQPETVRLGWELEPQSIIGSGLKPYLGSLSDDDGQDMQQLMARVKQHMTGISVQLAMDSQSHQRSRGVKQKKSKSVRDSPHLYHTQAVRKVIQEIRQTFTLWNLSPAITHPEVSYYRTQCKTGG